MDGELPIEHKAANHDTWRHIHRVQHYLLRGAIKLIDRAHGHDQSKLSPPEVGPFAELTPKLAATTYGSPEYDAMRKQLGMALAHHYANNRHHPECHKNGIEDMNLLDVLELFCDWTASSERHVDGNIRKSIELNADRFNIGPQLRRILENTVDALRDS